MRTPFAPAAINASITDGSRDAGPRVAKIFARLMLECFLAFSGTASRRRRRPEFKLKAHSHATLNFYSAAAANCLAILRRRLPIIVPFVPITTPVNI